MGDCTLQKVTSTHTNYWGISERQCTFKHYVKAASNTVLYVLLQQFGIESWVIYSMYPSHYYYSVNYGTVCKTQTYIRVTQIIIREIDFCWIWCSSLKGLISRWLAQNRNHKAVWEIARNDLSTRDLLPMFFLFLQTHCFVKRNLQSSRQVSV